MTLKIPNLCDTFLISVGCCWQIKASAIPNLDVIKGSNVTSFASDGCPMVARSLISPLRQKSDTVHAHVEFAAERFFGDDVPVATCELQPFLDRLDVLRGHEFDGATAMAGFRVPVNQIAIGSAFGCVVAMQGMLANEHNVVFSDGTLSVILDADEDSGCDVSFQVDADEDVPSFIIKVEGEWSSSYDDESLVSITERFAGVFNRLLFAKHATKSMRLEGVSNG